MSFGLSSRAPAVNAGMWRSCFRVETALSISSPRNNGFLLAGVFIFACLAFPFPCLAASPGDVVINEILYDVAGTDSGHEWVEIHNKSTSSVDLTGWKFREAGTNHNLVFTQGGAVIPAGGFAIIADNAAIFLADYASDANVTGGIVIDSVFSLSNSGESLALLDDTFVAISSLTYSASAPWPVGNSGRSIERISASGSDNDATNWALGPSNGSPHAVNAATSGGGGGGSTETNCSNNVDDDGDGKIDCDDPDCSSDTACQTSIGASTSTVKAVQVDDARNPFSPYDRDPAFQSGRVFFNVYSPHVVKTIRIANIRGETVRVLMNNDFGPASSSFVGTAAGAVTWDGRDDSGTLVPLGIYIVFLEGVDPTTGDRVIGRDTIVVGRPF